MPKSLKTGRLVTVFKYAKTEQQQHHFCGKPTFIVVVFNGEDSSPGHTCMVSDGFNVQRFDGERVDYSDRDSLWKASLEEQNNTDKPYHCKQ